MLDRSSIMKAVHITHNEGCMSILGAWFRTGHSDSGPRQRVLAGVIAAILCAGKLLILNRDDS